MATSTLIAPEFGHDSTLDPANPYCGINIFWGGKNGFDDSKARTVLHETGILCTNVADLNRDGYLDLVAGQQFEPAPGVPQSVIIYYGGPDGFTPARRVAIPCPGRSVPIKIADMDDDGWLDIITSSRLDGQEKIRIFHGSAQGFTAEAQETIPFFSALDLEIADLNGDGGLDLIATARADKEPTYTDLGVWIFWSNPDKHFRAANAQWLPARRCSARRWRISTATVIWT
ncbi:MAG: VCBS repeat-containing protein [Lacunisphaera sp.]